MKTRIIQLAVVLTVSRGCAPADSPPAPAAPPAASPSPQPPAPSVTATPPSSPDPTVAPPAPSPAPTPAPTALPTAPPVPGFVLYTRERTIILAADGSPPTLAAGLWVQDDRTTPPTTTHALVLTRARAEALALPACSCLALDDACDSDTVQLRRFDPRTGEQLADQSDPDCSCIRQPDEPAFPAMVTDDGEVLEPCPTGGEQAIASLVGGRLYSSGWDWNGACHESLSLYDAISVDLSLVSDPPPPEPTSDGMRPVGCYAMDPVTIAPPWPVGGGEAMDAETCEHYESEVFVLRRGRLWSVRDDMHHAGGSRSYLERPARPDACPSPGDPCGDPEPFRKRAKLDDRGREHWIATDGSMALTATKHAYALWKAADPAPLALALPDVDATRDVIGVRAHADVSRLRSLVAAHATLGTSSSRRAPETTETDRCHALHEALPASHADPEPAERTASAWGEDCYAHLRVGLWGIAEASCLRGLAAAPEPGTRGAILYNLGRIAEAQGARAQALEHYRRSLAARPGNATVKQRLAKLERGEARP